MNQNDISKTIEYFEMQKRLFPNSFTVLNGYCDVVLEALGKQLQENEPLTLDELKQMKGEQVYVTRLEAGKERQNTIGCGWYEVRDEHLYSTSKAIYFEVIENFFGWRAYRHKPKEAN